MTRSYVSRVPVVDKRVLLCLRSPLLDQLGFRHGFSLRQGGVSRGAYASLNLGRNVGDDPEAVRENHRRLSDELGYSALREVNQVHGGSVVVEPGADSARCDADALVGDVAGVALGIRVADCAAVLLADLDSGAVAAAHAGWRGVVAGVVPATLRALAQLRGGRVERFAAAVFPCLGVAAFEVGDDVAAQLAAVGAVVHPAARGGKPHVDLQASVRAQLLAAGLATRRVELVSGCTYTDSNAFFSYRRDAGVTGRHLAVILPRC